MDGSGNYPIEVDPVSNILWHRLAARSSVFNSPDWIAVLRETYGFEAKGIVIPEDQNGSRAGLAYCLVEDSLFGKRIVSLPFSDYCDPIANTKRDWEALIDVLRLRENPITIRCLRNEIAKRDARLKTTRTAKWHGLDLTRSQDSLWAVMRDSTRRAVEKARRQGVSVQVETSPEAVSEFYRMHLGVRKRKYRLLAQPRLFFENISQHFFPRKGFILMARHQGKPAAAVLFLIWNGTIYYKFNASDPDHLGLRPNDLLVWEGMLLGKRLGCRSWDFGLSDADQEGLCRFKRHFGSVEKEIAFLRYKPQSAAAGSQKEQIAGSLLGELTELFTEEGVPDEMTEKAGNLLYRYFA